MNQFDDLVDQAVQVHRAPLERFASSEDHQFIHEGGDPVDLPDDEPGRAFAASIARFSLEEFSGAANAAQRILYLVGDSGGDLAVRSKAVALGGFVLEIREGRAVAQHHHPPGWLPGARRELGNRNIKQASSPERRAQGDLVFHDGAAGLLDLGEEGEDWVIPAREIAEGLADGCLGRRLQHLAGLFVEPVDIPSGGKRDDPIEDRVENVLEVGGLSRVLHGDLSSRRTGAQLAIGA